MEFDEDVDKTELQLIREQRNQLHRMTSERYWSKYRGNWSGYLEKLFQYEDEIKTPPPLPIKKKTKTKPKPHNPFW